MYKHILACALLLPASAAAQPLSACAADPHAPAFLGRLDNLRGFMTRIERSTDTAEQRRLMAIHLKAMGESVRELRKREAGERCREEVMHSMLDQMLRHLLAEHEARER